MSSNSHDLLCLGIKIFSTMTKRLLTLFSIRHVFELHQIQCKQHNFDRLQLPWGFTLHRPDLSNPFEPCASLAWITGHTDSLLTHSWESMPQKRVQKWNANLSKDIKIFMLSGETQGTLLFGAKMTTYIWRGFILFGVLMVNKESLSRCWHMH